MIHNQARMDALGDFFEALARAMVAARRIDHTMVDKIGELYRSTAISIEMLSRAGNDEDEMIVKHFEYVVGQMAGAGTVPAQDFLGALEGMLPALAERELSARLFRRVIRDIRRHGGLPPTWLRGVIDGGKAG